MKSAPRGAWQSAGTMLNKKSFMFSSKILCMDDFVPDDVILNGRQNIVKSCDTLSVNCINPSDG